MARTDTLGHFLTDVADAIREKTGSSEEIVASDFDTEIENIPSGGGADLSEYFNTTIDSNTSSASKANVIKKIPDIIISDNVTSLSSAFYNYQFGDTKLKLIGGENVTSVSTMFAYTSAFQIDFSEFQPTGLSSMESMFISSKIENITLKNIKSNYLRAFTNMFSGCTNLSSVELDIETFATGGTSPVTRVYLQQMFRDCSSLTELDLSNFKVDTYIYNTSNMFSGCTNLTKIDIRGLNLSSVFTISNMFGSDGSSGVPDNCEIIVKDNASKTTITNNFSRLTNVKTVAEYEAE